MAANIYHLLLEGAFLHARPAILGQAILQLGTGWLFRMSLGAGRFSIWTLRTMALIVSYLSGVYGGGFELCPHLEVVV